MITVTSKRGTTATLIDHDPRRTELDGGCTIDLNGKATKVKSSAIASWEHNAIVTGKAVNLTCGGSGTIIEVNYGDVDAAVRVGDIKGHPEGVICAWFGVMEIN